MRFLLDENVHVGVIGPLVDRNHDVVRVPDILAEGSPDQLVATAAMQEERVLVSHDGDMKRIERKISEAHRDRYPTLSRLMLCLPEPRAAPRMVLFLPVIELEFELAVLAGQPMMFEIGERRVRIHR